MDKEGKNYVDSILSAAREPRVINIFGTDDSHPVALIPDGWQAEDLEKYLAKPLRKKAHCVLSTCDSFITHIKRHGSLASCVVYVDADYANQRVSMLAILDDHAETSPGWRENKASYQPPFSEEWKRWMASNKKQMSQVDFAQFIEDNQKDIAGTDGLPGGADMLTMALNLEAKQEVTFKSAIRLQSGTTELEYRDSEDADTVKKMAVFDRFDIGIPPLFGGASYRVSARLRYRIGSGKIAFWYELVRPDVTLQDALKAEIDKVNVAGFPVLFGKP